MSVKPGTIENPERDLSLTDRSLETAGPTAKNQLIALRQRIAEAKAVTPTAPIPECAACYRKGWMAALKYLE